MTINENDLKKCINIREKEYLRYYQTVLLTLGIKDYLDLSNTGCRFISAEPRLFIIDSDIEIQPDFILQYDNDKKGILGEIKTSIPINDEYLKNNDFKQLEKYCNDIYGWNTISRNINNHDILCIIHAPDTDRMIRKNIEFTKDGSINISKKFCISEFSILTSLKYGEEDIMLIRYRYGNLGCNILENILKENIKIDTGYLQDKYEVCKFTRREPPIEYVMDLLWTMIFPIFAPIRTENKDFEIDIKKILETVHRYYISWTGIKDEYSQVRERWIKNAMEKFVEINLVEKISKKPEKYKVLYGKQIPKDIKKYIIERCCFKKFEKLKKSEKKQKELINFISNK